MMNHVHSLRNTCHKVMRTFGDLSLFPFLETDLF